MQILCIRFVSCFAELLVGSSLLGSQGGKEGAVGQSLSMVFPSPFSAKRGRCELIMKLRLD